MKYIILLVALIGCKATEKTYRKVATDLRVTAEKKAIIAPWVSVYFPNGVMYLPGKTDTITEWFYADDSVVRELNELIDSLLLVEPKLVTVLQKSKPITKVVTIHKTDTVQVDNAGVVYALQRSLTLCEAERVKSIVDMESKEQSVQKITKQRNILIGILAGLLLMAGVITYFKLKL